MCCAPARTSCATHWLWRCRRSSSWRTAGTRTAPTDMPPTRPLASCVTSLGNHAHTHCHAPSCCRLGSQRHGRVEGVSQYSINSNHTISGIYSFYIGTSRVAIGPPLHTHFESLKTVLKSPLKSKTFCPSAMYTTGFAIWKVIFINLWIMEPVSFELLAITSLLI